MPVRTSIMVPQKCLYRPKLGSVSKDWPQKYGTSLLTSFAAIFVGITGWAVLKGLPDFFAGSFGLLFPFLPVLLNPKYNSSPLPTSFSDPGVSRPPMILLVLPIDSYFSPFLIIQLQIIKTNHRHYDAWVHTKHWDCPIISLGIFWSSVLPLPWIGFLLTCVSLGTLSVLIIFPLSWKSICKKSKVIKYIWMHGYTSHIGTIPLLHQVSNNPSCCLSLCPCPGNSAVDHCT